MKLRSLWVRRTGTLELRDFGPLVVQEYELPIQSALYKDLRVHDAAVGTDGDTDANQVVV